MIMNKEPFICFAALLVRRIYLCRHSPPGPLLRIFGTRNLFCRAIDGRLGLRNKFRVPMPGTTDRRKNLRCAQLVALFLVLASSASSSAAAPPESAATAESNFEVKLPPPAQPTSLMPKSPFGINTAFQPGTPDLDARLKAMQKAGIKWGRQDFTWRRIEKNPGEYDWAP